MAAHLENRDIQAGLEQAWHGLTKIVPVIEFNDAFPFEIERLPLLVANDTPLEGWSFFRCSDDGKPAGVPVFESYNALSNARFWEIVQNAVGGTGAIIESAGTISVAVPQGAGKDSKKKLHFPLARFPPVL